MKLIKKFSLIIILIFAVTVVQIIMQSVVKAANYYVNSTYTANYRGGGIGLKQTIYIDSDNTGRYLAGGKFVRDNQQRDLKGGLFKVRVIEVWNWDIANQYHPKQEIFRKDYFYYRSEHHQLKEYSVFDDTDVGYNLGHDIPAINIVKGLNGYGLRCLVPTWEKNGGYVYRDELVSAYDNTSIDKYLLKIYYMARKIHSVKNDYRPKSSDIIIDKNSNEVLVYVHLTAVSVLKNSVKFDDEMNLNCKVKFKSSKGIGYSNYKFFGNNFKNFMSSDGKSGMLDDKSEWLANSILSAAIKCIE